MTNPWSLFKCCTLKCLTSLPSGVFYESFRSYSFKAVFNMYEAYLRHTQGHDTFNFTFRYVEAELKFDREFNLSRKVSESVDSFLRRVDLNMCKVLDKRRRKLKRRRGEPESIEHRDNVGEGNIVMLKGGKRVEADLPFARLIEDPRDLLLVVFHEKYVIKFNAPWITELQLPGCILAGFPLYPSAFEALYTDKSTSKFKWFKNGSSNKDNSKGEDNWESIGEGFLYVPQVEDIGCRIKLSCLPTSANQEGPEVQVEGKSVVEAGPGVCPFEIRQKFTTTRLTGISHFRITSYNILADTYANSDYSRQYLFPYCPSYALAMDYRKLLIVKELIGYNSDILCLQEVDKKVYECDLMPALSSLNYSGTFTTKGDTREGLAVFYDQNRFQMLDKKCIVMGKNIEVNQAFSRIWDKIHNEKARQCFLERNTSLLIVTLQSRNNPSEILIIGNTHLYFHPDADHIRLLQSYFALTQCQSIVEYNNKIHSGKRVSLILSGDFNSTPADGIYELVTKKHIGGDHVNWKSNPEQIIENIPLSHTLSLASACGTPDYTNFTVDFADCLDYIFYQTNNLQVTQVVPMPSKEELSLHKAIPSIVFPSDHVAICADLTWIQ